MENDQISYAILLYKKGYEYKIKNRHLKNEEKIKKFFEIYQTSNLIEDSSLKNPNNIFLDENLNESDSSSDESSEEDI